VIQYTIRRLIFAVFVLWGVATICFMLTHIDALNAPMNVVREWVMKHRPGVRGPFMRAFGKDLKDPFQMGMGDPARIMLGQHGDVNTIAEIREELGLNRPLWQQYVIFFVGKERWVLLDFVPLYGFFVEIDRGLPKGEDPELGLLRYDLGTSYKTRQPCLDMILDKLGNTVVLALAAILLGVTLGVVAGILAAVFQDTWIDRAAMGLSILGLSAPIYLVGLILILVFINKLHWVPGVGMDESLLWLLQFRFLAWIVEIPLPTYLILPALALGVRPASNLARMTRSSMLEVIRQDYIRTARAKGLPESRVILKHAMKNALIPVVTIIGLEMAGLLTGAVLTETVFAWPGLGRLTVTALRDLDLPLIQGTVIFIALFFVISNLIVDLTYAFLDPRIRLK
jgi:peptide/nickel transport system permease protein